MVYISSCKDLIVWQKAMDFAENIYILTKEFPLEERYSLVQQLRRASVSVVSNIAEGSSRGSTKEFIRFISMSCGSLAEVETQLLISKRLHFFTSKSCTIFDEINEIGLMLRSLKKSLQKKIE